jgi:UDP-N-acetylmuramate dehydrogenase
MNAGCYGGETWRSRRARFEVVTRGGVSRVEPASRYATGYRTVRRADGSAPTSCSRRRGFRFRRRRRVARERIAELLRRRIATQPLNLPNAGSVFRNPPGDHAAR